jgi:hypothetical protein
MMAKAPQSQEEPTTIVGGLTKILLSIGVFAALVLVLGALMWLVRDMSGQNQETSRQLIESTTTAVNKMPEIAAEIRDDNRANSLFMREYTTIATHSREAVDLKLAAIEARLSTVQTELAAIRGEQQKTYEMFIKTAERIMGNDSKNEYMPPSSPNGGGASSGS